MSNYEVKEGFDVEGRPDLKYYAFDWDDNLMFMPTEIIVLSDNGDEVGMSTEDFAEYREDIGKKTFRYKGKNIIGYSDDPFINFRVEGDKQFIIDSLDAEVGPSWDDFVECINGGSIFAIITARGHNPMTIKDSVYNLIVTNHNGIDSRVLLENLKMYRDLTGEKIKDDQLLIDEYLDLCRFYPVSYGEGSASSPEQGKIKALFEFIDYVTEQSRKFGYNLSLNKDFVNDVSNNFVPDYYPKIGFSDDDPKNIESIKQSLEKEYGDENPVKTFLTKGGEKKEV